MVITFAGRANGRIKLYRLYFPCIVGEVLKNELKSCKVKNYVTFFKRKCELVSEKTKSLEDRF